ncbi:MAG: magnesium transporter CorA family protein [Asticcacaulis sp.]
MLIQQKKDDAAPVAGPALDTGVVWCDLYNPTREEELGLEASLGVPLPTREDMSEIEASSRLYLENGVAFMTAQVAHFGGQERLRAEPVTFALVKNRLVTIRYIDPASFSILRAHAVKQPALLATGQAAFLSLLDVIIDRTADLIEKTEERIDGVSRAIFRTRRETRLEDALIEIGDAQNAIAKIRDSLVSLARLTAFAHGLDAEVVGLDDSELKDFRDRLRTMSQDVASLSDHASYITGNMSFLLDAALGLISVEQNNVMKLISVVSVIFLPLTLIASIYGMNFEDMPFLHARGAFWWCAGSMVAIAAGLMAWLRSRRWI